MRLTKDFGLGERMKLSLVGEGFNIFNATNVRGSTNANFSGRFTDLSPTAGAESFYSAESTAGGFFGSGGARAFQFALRFTF
jgi:hypothetical protein